MARSPDARHDCPLLNREVFLGDCYEVQEVRNDDMDADLFPEKIDLEKARTICEKCKWYQVDITE